MIVELMNRKVKMIKIKEIIEIKEVIKLKKVIEEIDMIEIIEVMNMMNMEEIIDMEEVKIGFMNMRVKLKMEIMKMMEMRVEFDV